MTTLVIETMRRRGDDYRLGRRVRQQLQASLEALLGKCTCSSKCVKGGAALFVRHYGDFAPALPFSAFCNQITRLVTRKLLWFPETSIYSTPKTARRRRVNLLCSGGCSMFSSVNIEAALWPRAKESFRNFRIAALVVRFSGPLPPRKSFGN